MKWLLVVIVMNSPVKTDLVFSSLNACLDSEQEMRTEWTKIYNRAFEGGAPEESLEFIKAQMTHGTCIPSK